MEAKDIQLNQKLEIINQQIDKAFQNLSNNINKKFETALGQIREKVAKRNFVQRLKNIREIPNIPLIPNLDGNEKFNYLINPIIFCLANLEVIVELSFGERKEIKDIIQKIKGNNPFILYFIYLIRNMRDKRNLAVDYVSIHNYLKQVLGGSEIYMSQDPKFLINSILSILETEIKLPNYQGNNIPNIITDNFSTTIKTSEICNSCKLLVKESKEKQLVSELYLHKPVINITESLFSTFSSLLTKEEKKICEYCKNPLTTKKSIENSKKYLILNLNRENDPDKKMKLKYSNVLTIEETKDNQENQEVNYELISALADINDVENNVKLDQKNLNKINRDKLKIYFKNFINNKWYKVINGKLEDFNGNIEEELSNIMPNILIYKRI